MRFLRSSVVNRRRLLGAQKGQSIVELLIALFLGLVFAGGAAALYLSHRQTYSMIEGVSRLAENERLAIELLSRDIRDAGSTPCIGLRVPSAPSVNAVPDLTSSNAWAVWSAGMYGDVFGKGTLPIAAPSGSTGQVAGTGSLLIWTAANSNVSASKPTSKIGYHNVGTHQFTTVANAGYEKDDVMVACDSRQILTVQLSQNSTANTVTYTPGTGITTVNAGGFLSPLVTHIWYVGKTTDKVDPTTALRRLTINSTGSYASKDGGRNDEMIRDVRDMQISYLEGNVAFVQNVAPTTAQYVDAAAVVKWDAVTAVRVTLTFSTSDAVGNTGNSNAKMVHPITFTVALRNRLGVGT